MTGPFRAISRWWNGRKVRTQRRAKTRALAAAYEKALNQRFNARRDAWEKEDAELRSLSAMASGSGDWGQMMQRLGVRPSTRPIAAAGESGGNIHARYDAAQTTDDNSAHWAMSDGLAADNAANPMVRQVLKNRSRYEIANNCYAAGVGKTIASDFVGTGPRLHIDDDRLTEEEQTEVESKFRAWAAAINLAGKLRVMRLARRADGEVFAAKITNARLPGIKLDLRVLESDQVRSLNMSFVFDPKEVDGIKFDAAGNPVSYQVMKQHPGAGGIPWDFDTLPADQVIHWFNQDRPGQHRGLPEILPALPLYATLRRYTQAVLDAAETAADFAVLLHTESGAQFVDSSGAIIETAAELYTPFTTQDLTRRMMVTLPAGYDAKQFQPTQPTQEYAQFKREICGEIGRCESVTLNVVLGDSSQSNMASGTLDHKLYFRPRQIEREEAGHLILDNLLADWIEEGVRLREGDGDRGKPYLPQVLRTLGMSVQHSWYWDSNELGDPLKLAASRATELKSGITTIPGIYSRKAQDWKQAFTRNARALGVPFEEYQKLVRESIFGSGQPGQQENSDQGGADDGDTTSGTKKPGQAAMQKA